MDTGEKENLYTDITNTVLEMIPEKWDWVKLYAEYWDGYYKCYFYTTLLRAVPNTYTVLISLMNMRSAGKHLINWMNNYMTT